MNSYFEVVIRFLAVQGGHSTWPHTRAQPLNESRCLVRPKIREDPKALRFSREREREMK